MYAALWRALPGPWWLKALQSLLLVIGVVAFCFLWLFPRIEPLMPFNQTTVDPGTPTGTNSATSTTPSTSQSPVPPASPSVEPTQGLGPVQGSHP